MPTRVLYLIRHGQYDLQNSPPDELEGALTALGRRQAGRAARRLRGLPIDVIHHSDLRRAVETAAIIARQLPGVPLVEHRRLRECVPAVPAAFRKHFSALDLAGLARDRAHAERAFAFYFRAVRGEDRHEVIVCHGNLIRYFACRVLGAPPEAWANMDVHNAGLTRVEIEPRRRRVVSMNDTGHLREDELTYF